ncbi:MAG: extracellular solute-binding protein [Sphaerochaetaceae bacterium]|jgi:putative spermidine/putrescine transport system substrate-binding protein
MRKVFTVILLAVIALSVVSAAGKVEAPVPTIDLQTSSWSAIVEEAKNEGELTFLAWYFPDYFREAAADFEKEYGIKVNVIIGEQTANFNKLISEKDRAVGTVDVSIVGGQWVKTTMDLDLFYGPIKNILPDADKLAPSLWEVQEGVLVRGFLAPFHRNQTGILYDPQRVTNPPQTFKELERWIDANPRMFGFNDPSRGGSGQAFVHTVIDNVAGGLDRYVGDTEVIPEKVANWDLVWKWFNDRKDKLTFTVSNNDSIIKINDGQMSMTYAWDDNVQEMMNHGNIFTRAKMYIPEMGAAGGGDTLGVLKNAKNKAAGLVFIHHLGSKAQQEKKFNMVGAYPARTDVPLSGTLLTEADRTNNAIAWFPAPYKDFMISEFVKHVLMTK